MVIGVLILHQTAPLPDGFNGGDLSANRNDGTDLIWVVPGDVYANKVGVDINNDKIGDPTFNYQCVLTTDSGTYNATDSSKETYASAGPGYSGIRYVFNLNSSEKIISVKVTSNNYINYISKIFFNDEELIDNVPYPADGIVLTFPDSVSTEPRSSVFLA